MVRCLKSGPRHDSDCTLPCKMNSEMGRLSGWIFVGRYVIVFALLVAFSPGVEGASTCLRVVDNGTNTAKGMPLKTYTLIVECADWAKDFEPHIGEAVGEFPVKYRASVPLYFHKKGKEALRGMQMVSNNGTRKIRAIFEFPLQNGEPIDPATIKQILDHPRGDIGPYIYPYP